MVETALIANKLYEKVKLSEGTSLDQIAVKVIRNDCPEFLLPMRVVEIDGDTELRYEVAGGVAFNLQNHSMSKKETVELLLNMLEAFEKCPDYFLDIHKLYLDENHIYLGKDCKNVKYVYIPTDTYENDDSRIVSFFNKLIAELQITDDKNFQLELIRILVVDSNIHSLYEKLKSDMTGGFNEKKTSPVIENKPAENNVNPVQPAPQTKNTVNVQPVINEKPQPADTAKDDSLVNALFGDESPKKAKKNGGFFNLFGGKKHANEDTSEPKAAKTANNPAAPHAIPAAKEYTAPVIPAMDVTSIDGTDIEDDSSLYLELVDSNGMNCPRRINITFNNNQFVIGRVDSAGNRNADFCFERSFSSISRRHCCLETDGNNMYLIDLASTNHTYLNQNPLIPNNRYPISRGDVIRFTDKTPISYRVM